MTFVICPGNDSHRTFITRVQVLADYVVDEKGTLVRELARISSHIEAGLGNCITCATCGAPARIREL